MVTKVVRGGQAEAGLVSVGCRVVRVERCGPSGEPWGVPEDAVVGEVADLDDLRDALDDLAAWQVRTDHLNHDFIVLSFFRIIRFHGLRASFFPHLLLRLVHR